MMCGIAGKVYVNREREVEREILVRMRQAIQHRGPDDEGEYINKNLGLSFRRLAIIDVATGHQPIQNEDKSLAIIFNGEIYNHKALRKELEGLEHTFTTQTDTEVILHGYEQWGADVCLHLRGMFAFAIVNSLDGSLFIGRDRVGKKPLFYAIINEGTDREALLFASEVKSFLADPDFRRDINVMAINHYLSVEYIPGEMSIFKQAHKLLPGHWLRYGQGGKMETCRYWRLEYEPKWENLTEEQAVAKVDALIDDAVSVRLESEVPLGCFLSGGVDSSLVVAYMRRHISGNIDTFSIGFKENSHNELPYAHEVAEKFGTKHHEFIVEPDALECLGVLAWHFDEPMADSSGIPTYYLSKMTRQYVTVALNGDGGDESFAGYARYNGFPWLNKFNAIPRPIRLMMSPLLDCAQRCMSNSSRVELLSYINRITLAGPEKTYMAAMVFFRDYMKRHLFAPAVREEIFGHGNQWDTEQMTIDYMNDGNAKEWIDKMIYSDIMTYLPGALLPKVDRMTSAVGLEGRSPLLDQDVMEFAARLPLNLKFPNGHLKHLLKKVALPIFGNEFLERPKQGFGVPIGEWFRGPLREEVREYLLSKQVADRGFFDPVYLKRIYDEHTSGRNNHTHRIWALIMFEAWCRSFLDRPDPLAEGVLKLG